MLRALVLVTAIFLPAAASAEWKASPREKVAQLAAVSAFVQTKCSVFRVDQFTFNEALASTGEANSAGDPDVKRMALSWVGTLMESPEAGCFAVLALFGPLGTSYPGIIKGQR